MHNMLEIDKQELAEIKSLANPPKMVKKVMKALCTVLDIEPVLKKKEDGTFKPDYWIVSIGHKLLGNP
jgi:dynein heavy chain